MLCQVMELLYNPLLCKIAAAKKPSSMSETKQFSGCAINQRQDCLRNAIELEKNLKII